MKKSIIIVIFMYFLLLISFIVCCEIGEIDIFGMSGMIRYSWIMYFFIPVYIILLIRLISRYGKKKLIIINNFICIILLVIFGSYRFLFNGISYNDDKIKIIEQEVGLNLPDKIKISTEVYPTYEISRIKITDNQCKIEFESEIEKNIFWKKELGTKISSLLPFDIEHDILFFDYFVFYNSTKCEYNVYPDDGKHECVFIAYDCDLQRLIILNDYKIDIN